LIVSRPALDGSIDRYMRLVPEGDLIEICLQQMESIRCVVGDLSEDKAKFRYEESSYTF